MRTYNSFKEIEFELKKIDLERKIAWEEIKHSSNKIEESLTPYSWIVPIFNSVKKFGTAFFLRKILNK